MKQADLINKGNPYRFLDGRFWKLLCHWAEWRSLKDCPRGLSIPEAHYRWTIRDGAALAQGEPLFCLVRSTAPMEPTKLDEFNAAWLKLSTADQAYILALVVFQSEAFLRGKSWQRFLKSQKLKQQEFRTRLKTALTFLIEALVKRGLL